jgi:probable HAF family extracellular repeat protein
MLPGLLAMGLMAILCPSVLAQSVSISAPAPGSTFLAPATVAITGEVDLPEGEWFRLRVHKLQSTFGLKTRTDPIHIATIETNRFSLILTNLPAAEYKYAFILNTLNGNVASNHVTFAVTNFALRLGPFAVTDLGTLGGTQTMALAINNLGQAVGKARTASGQERAVFFENGMVRDLGTLGGPNSRALAINNKGEIVGAAETANGLSVPFLYRENQMQDLGYTEAAEARGINDGGDIVGTVASGGGFAILNGVKWALGFQPYAINNQRHVAGAGPIFTGSLYPRIDDLETNPPFVSDPTENSYISAKIYGGGAAYAINEARQFTGIIFDGDHRRYRAEPTLYARGDLQGLVGMSAYGVGLGINRWAEIVGSYLPDFFAYDEWGRPSTMGPTSAELRKKEAFMVNRAGMVNLNRLIPANSGWLLLEATDINDSGQIVGYGQKNGEVRAFRLDPVLHMAGMERVGNQTSGRLQATPGAVVNIEATADFKVWRPVSTETVVGFEIPFTDQSADGATFYRATVITD